ncbi:hypothetical protein GCM10022255_001420 [Dactylosporangium darangshiense]|uniref:Glyoxalase-like domain-containing protein n=1 Tax=Dactylosporangium darangshiense TaxID=579108 RepID=A0ABP8CTT8_9ACTN
MDAWVVSILRDPGPATHEGTGSGFLCMENDDPTAEQQCLAFAEVGVTPSDITRGMPTPGTSTGSRPPPNARPAWCHSFG